MESVRYVEAQDYSPPDYAIDSVDLVFDLDAERTIVRNTMRLRRLRPGAPLFLNGIGLELIGIDLDGKPLPATACEASADGITIRDCPEQFELTVRSACTPASNTSSRGLFLVGDTLASQCEAEGFRKITYFLDRPDVLARYRVLLRADEARFPVLLSNGNPTGSGRMADGRHWAQWDDPFPKPCYIFAVIAGRLSALNDRHVTGSGRQIALSFFCDSGEPARCQMAMDALKRSLAWDEATFHLEYDLDTYNVVALTGYGGAMENKGLNLFDTSGVLADADIATDDEAITIFRIIAHEVFHNWTGNRVTCRDWFQLCLKEGLTRYRDQRFTEDLTQGRYRIEAVRALMRNQFPEDDGAAAHPVRPSRYSTIENFYTNTVYDKGAEIVRMLETLLGRDAFLHGVSRYIEKNDGRAATVEDFIEAMTEVSGRDLTRFVLWYSQSGRPRLTLKTRYEPAQARLHLDFEQSGSEPMPVPVRVALSTPEGKVQTFRPGNGEACTEAVLEVSQARQQFELDDVKDEPLVSVLRGFSAPVSLEFTLSKEQRLSLLLHDSDPYVRWSNAQDLFVAEIRRLAACVRAGAAVVPDAALIDGLAPLFATEHDDWLVSELLLLPDEPRLSEGLPDVPLDSHMVARNTLQTAIAQRYKDHFCAMVMREVPVDGAFPDMAAIGARRLILLGLEYLTVLPDTDYLDRCANLTRGRNMTLAQGALAILANRDCAQRQPSLDSFLERWSAYPTVIDKWFMVQALSRTPDAIDRIIELEAHPALDKRNISRAMAYYGSFCRQNRVAFHDPSGKGYTFLADRLIESDRMGRASGRWLMAQITQWRRYDENRRALMCAALERVLATPGISNGLRELVTQTLSGGVR